MGVGALLDQELPTGLGPLYNSRACQSCHFKDGRGHPPNANYPDDNAESMFLRLSIPPETDEQKRLLAEHKVNTIDEPTYGGQLQNLAIQGHDGEGHMHIEYEDVPVKLADGTTLTPAQADLLDHRPQVRRAAPQDDAVAARGAADDRARPYRGHPRGADPRQR